MNDQPINTDAVASTAIALAARTLELLEAKGVISREEAWSVYEKTLSNLHPAYVEDGKRLIKSLIPGIKITDTRS
jgi:hypothetical protein